MLWDVLDNTIYELCNKMCRAVRISREGKYGFMDAVDSSILFNLKTKSPLAIFHEDTELNRNACFSYDEKYLLIGRKDGTITIYKTENGDIVDIIQDIEPLPVNAPIIGLSTNGNICLIVSSIGASNPTVKIWDIKKREYILNIPLPYPWFVDSLRFFNNDKHCIISTSIRDYVLDLENEKKIQILQHPVQDEIMDCIIRKPPYCIVDNYGLASIFKIELSSEGEFYYKKVSEFYSIDSIHVKNCNFKNCIADNQIKHALYQYGANI